MGTRLNLAVSRVLNEFTSSRRYVDLLISLITRLEEVDDLLSSLATERWLDTAVGVWLDMIGVIVGIPRFYGENEGPFFEYKDAYPGTDDPTKAYSGPYPDPATGGRYQSVFGLNNNIPISDDAYRRWIKAKAKATGSAGTLEDIWVFINEALELTDHVVETGGTRLVTITTTAPLTPWKQGKIRQWAPVNGGIGIQFIP